MIGNENEIIKDKNNIENSGFSYDYTTSSGSDDSVNGSHPTNMKTTIDNCNGMMKINGTVGNWEFLMNRGIPKSKTISVIDELINNSITIPSHSNSDINNVNVCSKCGHILVNE